MPSQGMEYNYGSKHAADCVLAGSCFDSHWGAWQLVIVFVVLVRFADQDKVLQVRCWLPILWQEAITRKPTETNANHIVQRLHGCHVTEWSATIVETRIWGGRLNYEDMCFKQWKLCPADSIKTALGDRVTLDRAERRQLNLIETPKYHLEDQSQSALHWGSAWWKLFQMFLFPTQKCSSLS